MYIQQKKISNFNTENEVINQFSFPDKVKISDCLLRDGEQMAGLAFNVNDKVEMAKLLDELGVDEIESGMPASSDVDKEAISKIISKDLSPKIVVLARTLKKDIDLASDLGAWGVSISLPFGDLQRKHKIKWSDEELIDNVRQVTHYAKDKGLNVTLSPYDTTRVNPSYLTKFLNKIKGDSTIDRLRIVDTVGSITPEGIKYLTKKIKNIYDIEIEIHCHDDFGLGSANTLAALSVGANVASVTMNGLGERSGNTSLEEVVASLEFLYNVKTKINISKLKEISEKIENITGVKLQKHKAIVGENSFRHESGMVVAGLLKDPFVAEAIKPELIGQKRQIIIGKGSGVASLEYKLNELNLDRESVDLKSLLVAIKNYSVQLKRSLTNEEVKEIYNQVITQ